MILKWNKPSVTKINGHFVYPGDNTLPDNEKETILALPWVKQKMEMSPPLIEIVDKKKEKSADGPSDTGSDTDSGTGTDDTTSDITEMSIQDAVDVVIETFIIADLEAMAASEKRKSVLKAINKQIKLINKKDEE